MLGAKPGPSIFFIMIKITASIHLLESELIFTFIRSPGPGGQNVNKVATAVQLRFNVLHSTSLPESVRARLLALVGNKLIAEGDLLIKANRYRIQERNKQDALNRLKNWILDASKVEKKRHKTKPTYRSTQKRLKKKALHAKAKALRKKFTDKE